MENGIWNWKKIGISNKMLMLKQPRNSNFDQNEPKMENGIWNWKKIGMSNKMLMLEQPRNSNFDKNKPKMENVIWNWKKIGISSKFFEVVKSNIIILMADCNNYLHILSTKKTFF